MKMKINQLHPASYGFTLGVRLPCNDNIIPIKPNGILCEYSDSEPPESVVLIEELRRMACGYGGLPSQLIGYQRVHWLSWIK